MLLYHITWSRSWHHSAVAPTVKPNPSSRKVSVNILQQRENEPDDVLQLVLSEACPGTATNQGPDKPEFSLVSSLRVSGARGGNCWLRARLHTKS